MNTKKYNTCSKEVQFLEKNTLYDKSRNKQEQSKEYGSTPNSTQMRKYPTRKMTFKKISYK